MSDSNSPIKKIRRVALATHSESKYFNKCTKIALHMKKLQKINIFSDHAPTKTNNDLILKTIEELKETTVNLQQQLNVIQGKKLFHIHENNRH